MKKVLIILLAFAFQSSSQADPEKSCSYQCLLTAKRAQQNVEWLAQSPSFLARGGYTHAMDTDCAARVTHAGVPIQAEVMDQFGRSTALVLRVGTQAISSQSPGNQGSFVITMDGETVYELSCFRRGA